MKLLILTCNTGQGHNSTAGSISEKFTSNGCECTAADSLAFLSKKMSRFISSWHTRIYRHAPILFDQGYEYAEKHPSVFADESMAYNFFGHGVNKLNRYMDVSSRLPKGAVLTVACGTNERLKKKLEKAERANLRVLGYTDKISQLMDSADLYMTKPGGLSVTEAAVKRLPMLFVDAVSGCETYNKNFFLSRHMAAAAENPALLARECVRLLFDAEALAAQKKAMEAEFCTDPADCIFHTFFS